jgi:molybdenum cofactor synthesis domain-containing protein
MLIKAPANTFKAGLIIIGNEILSGRTHDTNTPWIAEKLVTIGVVLVEVRVVQDVEAEIIFAVNDLKGKVDYLFTTGGIGPTHDDITAATMAKCFGMDLEVNAEALEMMIAHYGRAEDITPARKKMAMIPKGATLIDNPVSGPPGFKIENVFVMAGVPRIMQAMFDNVMLMLTPGQPLLSNTIACSLQESLVADKLEEIQHRYPEVSIGSYPHYRGGLLGLSLVLRTTDRALLKSASQEVIDLIRNLGGHPQAISVLSDKS